MCAGSSCRPWGNKHQSKYSPNFDTELGKTNVGQGRVLPAQSCAKLTHVFPLARACLLVCVRHGLAGAESEGGSTADQPGSAKARSASPRRDTGKVRLPCHFFFLDLALFTSCPDARKSASFLPPRWTCCGLENPCGDLCSLTKVMSLHSGFSAPPSERCHVSGQQRQLQEMKTVLV